MAAGQLSVPDKVSSTENRFSAFFPVDRSTLAARLVALNPAPVLVLTAENAVICAANPAAEAFFGREQAGLCGQHFVEFFRHLKDGEHILAERPESVALQYLLAAGGRHRPVQISFRRLEDEGLLLVFLRDLSAELALDNQSMIAQRNYKLLFENAPQPMLMVDRDFIVSGANRAAAILYGFVDEERPPGSLKSLLVNPRDLDYYRISLEPLALPPHWHRCKEDRPCLLEATVSTLRRERQTLLLVALRDVTESERQLAELRHAEERWHFALNGHGDGVWEWLPKTGEAIVSERFLEMLGFPTEDAQHNFDYWDARVHPDDYQRMHLAIMQHFFAESPVIDGEYRMMSIDGQYRWLAIRARATELDAAGRIERIIGSVRDVHEQRRQEQRERQQQEQLMHTARLATMGELVTMIAHEVTQPLTAISNYAAVARRHMQRAGHADELGDAVHALTRVSELVGHAGEVVHRIRSFVRKGELKLEPLQINGLLADVARLADIQARSMGAEIELDLADDLPEIIGDRMQLGQMLLNLARNGLEAMPAVDGPFRLKLRARLNSQDEIEVEVEDCGCGLSAALAMDVITPFFTTKPEGLGMGLAICKTVVENHRGRLWATAAKPRGTIFHVSLPVR